MKKAALGEGKALIRGRRRKPTKSCHFCRLRKLKCDRKRPFCGSCISSGQKQCDYEEITTSKEVQLINKYRKSSKLDMARRIEELESRVPNEISNYDEVNPLCKVKYLSSKHNRHILYGPTSYRTLLATQTKAFARYREDIWKALKSTRNNWKREHQYSTLSEISSIEVASPHGNSTSVVEALCNSLPSFEAFSQNLSNFFDSDFYKSYSVVSKGRVLKDFNNCFVKGKKNSKTNCHPIIAINLDIKKNYYKVGVMTVILCLISYQEEISDAVQTFHKFLISFLSAKVFYIERVEFLFLRYLYVNLTGRDGGDQSHCIFLHGLAIDTAIHIGLNEDLRHLFKNNKQELQDIVFHERLWLWILLTDVKIALSTGIPLRISDDFVLKNRLEGLSTTADVLLSQTVLNLRSIMKQIHERKVMPDIPFIIEELGSFVKKNFKPLSFYLDITNLNGNEFTELQLWHIVLHMQASLSNVELLNFHNYSPAIFNMSISAPLNTLKLCFKVLEGYFELDKFCMSSVSDCSPRKWPHSNIALFLIYMDSFRALIQIYTLALHHSENGEYQLLKGSKVISNSMQVSSEDIESSNEHYLSLKSAFRDIETIFDSIYHEKFKELRGIWHNSYYFSIIISMEKIGRKTFRTTITEGAENAELEFGAAEDRMAVILNDLEDYLADFSTDFNEGFFNTNLCDWDDFPQFFT